MTLEDMQQLQAGATDTMRAVGMVRGRTDKTRNKKECRFFLLEPFDVVYT